MAFEQARPEEEFDIPEDDLKISRAPYFKLNPRLLWAIDRERDIIAALLGGITPLQLIAQYDRLHYAVIKYNHELHKILYLAKYKIDEERKLFLDLSVDLHQSEFPTIFHENASYRDAIKLVIEEALPTLYSLLPSRINTRSVDFDARARDMSIKDPDAYF